MTQIRCINIKGNKLHKEMRVKYQKRILILM